jgi:Tfp pilus assembly protein PilF
MASMLSTRELVVKAEVSVALIEIDRDGGRSGGTGIIYSENGLALTNEHVIRGAKTISVTVTNAAGIKQKLAAEILDANPHIDLAIIRFEGAPYLNAKLGSFEDIDPGDEVVALGYPLLFTIDATLTVTDGIVSNIRSDGKRIVIQHTASINPGNSGGPLLSKKDGAVVGINSEITRYTFNPQPADEDNQNNKDPFKDWALVEGFNHSVAIDEATSMIAKVETGTLVTKHSETWALVSSGISHHHNGRYESAIRDYTKAIKLDSGYYNLYIYRGHAYSGLGQYENAIQDYDAAIPLITPQTLGTALAVEVFIGLVYSYKGTAYYALGQYKGALRYFDKTIKHYDRMTVTIQESTMAISYNNRGNAYNGLGQYERAIRDYNKAIKLNGQLGVYYSSRSNAYGKASARDKAKAKELGYDP